ncbi:MAG: GDP-mannose 4,6-dehydratase [Flammeovirgaceae bacterium]
MSKRAFIIGVSGQDGSYLSKFLLEKGYEVCGSSRDAQGSSFLNLKKLGINTEVQLFSVFPEDFRSVFVAINKSRPDEIYYLAGQSSVGLSFEQPAETIQSSVLGTLNILEVCRLLDYQPKLYHAGSSECFGDVNGMAATESTIFHPKSPYAVAKASAYWLVDNYRDAYSIFACTGILFNHESPLRPARFVTRKIISAATRIAHGTGEKLRLGRLDIARDWGWAPDYVEAMWLMLQQNRPEDFVVATGETNSLKSFVQEAFSVHGLNWEDHVIEDKSLYRPSEILISRADPSKAEKTLRWKAKVKMREVVKLMTAQEMLQPV